MAIAAPAAIMSTRTRTIKWGTTGRNITATRR